MDLIIGTNPGIIKMTARCYDENDPLYIEGVDGMMFSYAVALESPKVHQRLWKQGFKQGYNLRDEYKIFLDNGSFTFSQQGYTVEPIAYRKFVEQTSPDWYPMPQDYIPGLDMPLDEQWQRMEQTMRNNHEWSGSDYAMILHTGACFDEYIKRFKASETLMKSKYIALGALASRRLRVSRLTPDSDVSGGRSTYEYIKETPRTVPGRTAASVRCRRIEIDYPSVPRYSVRTA